MHEAATPFDDLCLVLLSELTSLQSVYAAVYHLALGAASDGSLEAARDTAAALLHLANDRLADVTARLEAVASARG